MAKRQSKKGRIKQKLIHKFRLVILNEDTFQELFSMKLSRLNVFVFIGFFSLLMISLTVVLIAFTSLKEYIPGYSSTALKKKATRLVYETDSLKQKLAVLENFTQALRPVLKGEIAYESIDSIRTVSERSAITEQALLATKEDSLFRKKIERENRFQLIEGSKNRIESVFFAPLSGNITQNFDTTNKHYAIDIVAQTGTPVKSIADGTIILAEWTADTGYVLMIQHANNFISVYKHNGTLLKEQGDEVKSGEVVATVGSTGELTTGPHLHFELWHKGYPENPSNYIDFQ